MTDIQLASKSTNNLVLTTTDTLTNQVTITFPQDQFGARYILCHADAGGNVIEDDENNNVLASSIMLFESPHPDIKTQSLLAPATVKAGVSFHLTYQLTNIGDRAVTQSITDSIFISFSSTWSRATATPLGTHSTTLLDTSQVISFDVLLSTPISQNPNLYYLYIISDATSKVYEGSGEANNIQRSAAFVLEAYPEIDLALHSISGIADTLTSGQSVLVTYTVQNLSSASTYYYAWTEKWYLSVDSLWSPSTDMLMGSFVYNTGKVLANGTRTPSARLSLPHGITGDYYVFIETDAGDLNKDIDRNNNHNTVRVIGHAKKIHIKLEFYPDLAVSDFNCPVEINSGQYFDIITKVANDGNGFSGSRTDKIFVSANNTIEIGDLALATVVKSALAPGQMQADTHHVFVPANYNGNYFILYSIDHGNAVYEHGNESNNFLITSIIATPPPPADLIVKNILVPDSVLAGEIDTITWQTENKGSNPAYGQFREIVYLSLDTTWQVTDEVLGIWDGQLYLSSGTTTTKSLGVPYNNVTNANYHTLIRTDARNNIPESNEENNDGYSFDLTNVDIEEIFLEDVKNTDLLANANRYFKVYIDAGNAERNVLIELTGDSLSGINQMYVKHGTVPTEAENDYAYDNPSSPHQRIVIHGAIPGYYYIMIKGFRMGTSAAQQVSILARILKMELLEISPDEAGNHGMITMEGLGSELDSLTQVKLIRSGNGEYLEIEADTFVTLDGGIRILARFNLTGRPVGIYHVQCIRDNKWVATLQNCFTIIEGDGHEIAVRWELTPKSYNPRLSTIIQMKIDIENIGDADAEDRFVLVGTPDFNNPVFYSLADYYNGINHTQLELPSEDLNGFPNILRPGGRRTYYVYGQVGGTQGFSVTYDK